MVDIAGFHGIGHQQGGRNQMLPAWERALHDGVERARGRDWSKPSLDLIYYGDLFLDATSSKGPADVLADIDDDTVEFLTRVQDEVVDPSEPVDLPAASKGMKELPGPVAKLASWLDRNFGVAGKLLFFGDLVQVRRYQRDEGLAQLVLERTEELFPASPLLLIGHSLGSIIAYEALCLIKRHAIQTLITLGSPLGLRSIRDALRPEPRECIGGMPHGVTKWVNIYDESDPVCLAGGLTEHWQQVVDETVDNGNDPHAVTRYLGKKVTGSAVVAALSQRW